ncbi:Uma2 family endonuclease [Pendulispora rubella]|uniref:Uma2 family endonuclease n=1 Tax=Pendulispora rubella TaxID=2741070 RepID=A0ABZ2LGC1_9BACT
MANVPSQPYVSLEDFWAAEETSETRHEWLDGIVYDMSRGSIEHGRLTAAITIELGNALKGKCTVYGPEVMLYIAETRFCTYADANVVWGPAETFRVAKLGDALTNPSVLVEVLSDSTEQYDRGEKFAHYMRMPSVREYVLVSQHERRIEVFRRPEYGRWFHEVAQAGESLTLHGEKISVDSVYANLYPPQKY